MSKEKSFPCIYCGVDDENVSYVSDGKGSKVQHINPFHCIENLKKQIEGMRKSVNPIIAKDTIFGGPN